METRSHDEAQQVSLDTAAGLSYDYLKQLGTIAMTAAGGLIALVQFVEGDRRFFVKIMIATSMMFLAALLAFLAQYSLVDRLRQAHRLLQIGKPKSSHVSAKKAEKIYEGLALWLLSISMGIALYALMSAGGAA